MLPTWYEAQPRRALVGFLIVSRVCAVLCAAAVMADEINLNMAAAREEASLVLCGAVEKVLKKTGIDAKSIDAVVVNCSLFSPTPSLSSIVRVAAAVTWQLSRFVGVAHCGVATGVWD